MKHNKTRKEPAVTKPLLRDIIKIHKAQLKRAGLRVSVGSTPLGPSDLFQDPGSRYNAGFNFPQE